MEKPLKITLLGIDSSPALDTHIREKARKLEEFHPRISGCHVTIEKPHRHHSHGAPMDVRIAIHVPGRPEVVVNRQHHDDVYVAMRDAFDSARRMLDEHGRDRREARGQG